MSALGFHVTIRTVDDSPIAPSDRDRRAVARVALAVGRAHGLFVFGVPDWHFHGGLVATRDSAGRFAQRLELALKAAVPTLAPLEPARIRPFRDGRHRANTVRYCLTQAEHHGVTTDPYRECSNLPDLLGLRLLGAYTLPRVREVAPRLQPRDVRRFLGLPMPEPGSPAPDALVEAALAATALPSLAGRHPEVNEARLAAVHAAPELDAAVLADALGLTARAVRRLRARTPREALVRAVRLQASLRDAHPAPDCFADAPPPPYATSITTFPTTRPLFERAHASPTRASG
ncbi:MAG: hypothetical protein ACOZNI_01480 [Myxococcota bacterium]